MRQCSFWLKMTGIKLALAAATADVILEDVLKTTARFPIEDGGKVGF